MGRYSGQKCPVCSQKFQDSDEVVVCPVCGTPHHRQCWIDDGGCRNANLHGTDFQWKATATASDRPDFDEKRDLGEICPVCGKNNPKNTLFCPGCGTPLGAGRAQQAPGGQQSYRPPFGFPFAQPFDDQQSIQGIPVKEVASVVKINAFSYIPKFLRMERKKVPVSFNWFAFLLAPFWFIYRKMYLIGGILTALLLAFGIAMAPAVNAGYEELYDFYEVAAQAETSPEQLTQLQSQLLKSANVQAMMISSAVNLLLMVASGFAANPAYRHHVVHKAKKARTIEDPYAREKFLQRWSGVNIWAAVVSYLLYRLAGMAVSYFLL